MLYPNGQRALTFPGTRVAGQLAASGTTAYSGIGGARFNRYVSDTYSKVVGAVPSGYSGRAYIFAVKAGGLTAANGFSFTPVATGGLGLPGDGSASISFTVADAIGQLISSGQGSASMSFTFANALLTASLGAVGSASFTLSSNSPVLGAKADGIGAANFAITGTLTPYAIGTMSGSTVDTSILTTAAILAAMNASPPAVNIKKVNDYAVTGDGQTGSEWGPI